MLRRRSTPDFHRSAIRLGLFDAVVLAPVIILPLAFVVSLALFSMVTLFLLTGVALGATIAGDIARRIWRATRAHQPVAMPRRAIG
jgi:hypothetical protein